MSWEIREGDCRALLPEVETESVSLVCTDPPYGWSFMDKHWDTALPNPAVWRECLRVLKPGGFAFVMAGARSDCLWRLCRDLEEAGFDLSQSMIHWVYRSGFPKSLNVSKDFDKAAFLEWVNSPPNGEQQTRAEAMGWGPTEVRKAASAAVNGEGTVAFPERLGNSEGGIYAGQGTFDRNQTRERHLTGALLLSSLQARFGPAPGVRVKTGEYQVSRRLAPEAAVKYTYGTGLPSIGAGNVNTTAPSTPLAQEWDGWHSSGLKPSFEICLVCQKPFRGPLRENLRKHGVGGFNISECRIPFAGDIPRGGFGGMKVGMANIGETQEYEGEQECNPSGRYPATLLCSDDALGAGSRFFSLDAWAAAHGLAEDGWAEAGAEGFVQIPKAGRSERNAGCDGLPVADYTKRARPRNSDGHEHWIDRKDGRGPVSVNAQLRPRANHIPTVKPLRLMSYLLHLACPKGGLVLDPFAGSGSTIVAAILGGWPAIGMEVESEYAAIARARCHWAETEVAKRTPQLELIP